MTKYRYSWTATGMKKDPEGSWVLQSEFERLDADAAGVQAELASIKLENERLHAKIASLDDVIAYWKARAGDATAVEPGAARPSAPLLSAFKCSACGKIADNSGDTVGWALCQCGSFRQPEKLRVCRYADDPDAPGNCLGCGDIREAHASKRTGPDLGDCDYFNDPPAEKSNPAPCNAQEGKIGLCPRCAFGPCRVVNVKSGGESC